MGFFCLSLIMKITDLHKIFLKNSVITIDSRKIEKGAIFFAIKGENFDGNKFAKDAIDNGCAYVIVDNHEVVDGSKYILVEDTLKTLQELASYHRNQLNMPIIAITGTNGKTTTKELIATVLSKKYKVSFTEGNYNNHIGVPLTLLKMNEDTQIGVVEMGANHLNEIEQLCEIASPNYGLITNIGKAHIEGFGSFENVIKAKKELYDYIKLVNGKVFFNKQNTILSKLVADLDFDAIAFGDESSIVNGQVLPSNRFVKLSVNIEGETNEVETHLIGNYNLENILASISIGKYFNIDNHDIISAIEEYIPKNNRSQFLKTNKNNLILDAYNANPTSVEAALGNFIALDLENKCVILGDMLELGEESENEHENIVDFANNQNFETIILVGNIYSSLQVPDNILQFEEVGELKKWISKNNLHNANILIKGSRGIQLEQIVELL